ncbi:MAG: hypothetical protein JW902_06990 [Syntrophaceae bacterium]|nr:hypothetical protein [Syntrophaceae bacterium]
MGKESERVKNWRERQKAVGKTSITILLSQEARLILAEEKQKTGETYASIIEKALHNLKKHGYKQPERKRIAKSGTVSEKVMAKDYQTQSTALKSQESEPPKKVLIDDLTSYPNIQNIEKEQAANGQSGIYDNKLKDGLFSRLLRLSVGSLGRKKKWF